MNDRIEEQQLTFQKEKQNDLPLKVSVERGEKSVFTYKRDHARKQEREREKMSEEEVRYPDYSTTPYEPPKALAPPVKGEEWKDHQEKEKWGMVINPQESPFMTQEEKEEWNPIEDSPCPRCHRRVKIRSEKTAYVVIPTLRLKIHLGCWIAEKDPSAFIRTTPSSPSSSSIVFRFEAEWTREAERTRQQWLENKRVSIKVLPLSPAQEGWLRKMIPPPAPLPGTLLIRKPTVPPLDQAFFQQHRSVLTADVLLSVGRFSIAQLVKIADFGASYEIFPLELDTLTKISLLECIAFFPNIDHKMLQENVEGFNLKTLRRVIAHHQQHLTLTLLALRLNASHLFAAGISFVEFCQWRIPLSEWRRSLDLRLVHLLALKGFDLTVLQWDPLELISHFPNMTDQEKNQLGVTQMLALISKNV